MPAELEIIRSRSNPLVTPPPRASRSAATATCCLLEGPKLLRGGAGRRGRDRGGRRPRRGSETSAARAALLARAARRAAAGASAGRRAPRASLSEAETSQGVLALARRPALRRGRALRAARRWSWWPSAIQNPGNLGGAAAHGRGGGRHRRLPHRPARADPFSWKALRGSMGSAFRLPHVRGARRRRGARRGCAAPGRGRVAAVRRRRPCATTSADLRGPARPPVRAARARACRAEVRPRADQRVSIPMRGRVESLNVGVAAGVLLFEAARQRRREAAMSPASAPGDRAPARSSRTPEPRASEPRVPTLPWPTACGRAPSTRSWARTRSSARASRCAARSSRTQLRSLILWGPPGSGKTTLAHVIRRRDPRRTSRP